MAKSSDMLDALMNDLRADGAVDSEGQFTLDREQARAKLQKFQLVDARRYVLELVQAAVLRGAEKIEFQIDADDMRLRFGGTPFTEAEIDDLYGSLFATGDTRELRGVRQLALALNAAIGMNPKFIHLRSGKLELRMRPGQADEIIVKDTELRSTELHVKQRVRPRLMLDFFLNLGGRLAEQTYLRERCGYADVPIFLDGARISKGLASQALGHSSLQFHGPEFSGVMHVASQDSSYARLDLVKDGVWIDSRELLNGGTNLRIVVDGERLRKDVSQAKIVDDEALSRITEAVGRARWKLWTIAKDEATPATARQIAALIQTQLIEHSTPAQLRDDPQANALTSDVTWPDCRGTARQVSLRELIELVQAGKTPRYASRVYAELTPEGDPVPLLERVEARRLGVSLGADLIEADSLLAREQLRARGRKAWRERKGDPVLPTHVPFLVQGPIATPHVRGEVGVDTHTLIDPELEHPTQVLLYKRSCLLGRLELELDIPNLWLVLDAEFEPTDDYQDAIRDGTFVLALLHGLSALREPFARMLEHAAGHPNEANARGLVKRWLVALLDQPTQASLLSKAGADVAPGHYVKLLPKLHADQLGPRDAHDPLAQCPLFEQLDGPRLSLADVAAHHRVHGHIRYLPGRPQDPRLTAPEVLLLGPGDRKIIRALFGPDSYQLVDHEPMLRELRHFDQPQVTLATTRAQIERRLAPAGARLGGWLVELDGEVEGFIVPAFGPLGHELQQLHDTALATTSVAVYRDGRFVCDMQLKLGWGPLLAVVESPKLRADELWETVVEDEHWRTVVASLRSAARRLFTLVVRNYESEVASVRRWLARVLVRAAANEVAPGQPQDGESRVDAIRSLNMFDTVSGSVISLLRIERIHAEHGAVEIVERDTSWAAVRDPEIVKLDPDEVGDLRKLLGARDLEVVDGAQRLSHQQISKQLQGRPRMTEAKLDPAKMLVIRDLHGDRRHGEIGISRTRTVGSLHLRLGVAGRLVHELNDHSYDFALPVDAVVIDESIPLNAKGDPELESKRYRNLLRQIRRNVPSLVLDLCSTLDDQPQPFRRAAWPVLVAHLRSDTDENRRKVREKAFVAASQVPGFRDLWGVHHDLATLIAKSRKRPLGLLVKLRPQVPKQELDARVILVVDEDEAACIEAHANAERFDDDWAAELASMKELANAPKLEAPELDDIALVERKAQVAGGLDCQLWIPRDFAPLAPDAEPPQLVFARNGRELQRMALVHALPCAGVVNGDGLDSSPGEVQLDGRQSISLARQIVIMYVELAKQLETKRLSAKDRERALEYLSWASVCFERGQTDGLGGLGKHVDSLRELLRTQVPPTLRNAARQEPATVAAPPPKPAPTPAPTPASETTAPAADPAPPPTTEPHTPSERLLAALYEQLQWARARHGDVLDQLRLAHLELLDTGDDAIAKIRMSGIAVNTQHPLVARLLAPTRALDPIDPIELAFVVAAIYTLMNHFAQEITDDDERVFVAQLAETLALSVRASGR
ncbi:hypothetical protein DB30_03919 [Enhygromyxa salina]|uniref:Uncharacterized protein n=1 Tax=Enhygromyxa salina TaxID=215803 RepID=A0A0C2D5E8_9BACT|nr:hypothetical protein [Enhygromyxa salina]KIG16935.1 hypothetical protein DB30_03919 [Enhygromyxa salina]